MNALQTDSKFALLTLTSKTRFHIRPHTVRLDEKPTWNAISNNDTPSWWWMGRQQNKLSAAHSWREFQKLEFSLYSRRWSNSDFDSAANRMRPAICCKPYRRRQNWRKCRWSKRFRCDQCTQRKCSNRLQTYSSSVTYKWSRNCCRWTRSSRSLPNRNASALSMCFVSLNPANVFWSWEIYSAYCAFIAEMIPFRCRVAISWKLLFALR